MSPFRLQSRMTDCIMLVPASSVSKSFSFYGYFASEMILNSTQPALSSCGCPEFGEVPDFLISQYLFVYSLESSTKNIFVFAMSEKYITHCLYAIVSFSSTPFIWLVTIQTQLAWFLQWLPWSSYSLVTTPLARILFPLICFINPLTVSIYTLYKQAPDKLNCLIYFQGQYS